jgi:hypothetical protein
MAIPGCPSILCAQSVSTHVQSPAFFLISRHLPHSQGLGHSLHFPLRGFHECDFINILFQASPGHPERTQKKFARGSLKHSFNEVLLIALAVWKA